MLGFLKTIFTPDTEAATGRDATPVAIRYGLHGYFGGGQIWNQGAGSDARPAVGRNNPAELAAELPQFRHTQIIAASRYLFANTPALRGMYSDRATYVVGTGWRPIFRGQSKEWGRDARRWLQQWFALCDVKGFPFSFNVHMRAACLSLDRDGDYAIQRVKGAGNYPLLQFHPAHRIGSRQGIPKVASGEFAGNYIVNGAIVTAEGRTVGYNLLGPTAESDQQIPSTDLILNFATDFFDSYRGIPNAAQAIDDWADLRSFQDFEKLASLVGAAHTLIESNEQGEMTDRDRLKGTRPSAGAGPTNATTNAVQVQEFARGLVRYISTKGGGNLKMMEHNRPSPNTMKFLEEIFRSNSAGADWPFEFWRDMSKLTSAGVHGVFGKAQRSVEIRQATLAPVADWIRDYGLAVAMMPESKGGIGVLPFNPEWREFSWQLPRRVNADNTRNAAQEIEEIKMGVRSVRRHIEEDGNDFEQHMDQIESEIDDRMTRAERLNKKHPQWSLAECMNQLQQRTPNANAAGASQQSAPTETQDNSPVPLAPPDSN